MNSTTDLDDDFRLCEEEFSRVTENKPKHFPVSKYSQRDRVIVLVWHFAGIIENSGFAGVLGRDSPGDPDFKLLGKAFSTIGCGELIGNVANQFPDSAIPSNRLDRVKYWDTIDESVRVGLNKAFWDAEDEITRKLALFIRTKN